MGLLTPPTTYYSHHHYSSNIHFLSYESLLQPTRQSFFLRIFQQFHVSFFHLAFHSHSLLPASCTLLSPSDSLSHTPTARKAKNRQLERKHRRAPPQMAYFCLTPGGPLTDSQPSAVLPGDNGHPDCHYQEQAADFVK